MRRISLAVVSAALLVSTLQVGMPAAHAGSKATATYYLALGDSVAAGFQPNTGLTTGYVGRVWRHFRTEIPGLGLRNLACPGETTASMITGKRSKCHYGAGSQLDAAVSFLGAHAGAIAFITIDIGANDLIVQCLNGRTGLWGRACAKDERPRVRTRLANVLDALATAAPGVPIVGMTYYDPFLGLWGRVPGGYKLAKADHRVMNLLNAALKNVYGDAGVPVADMAATFRTRRLHGHRDRPRPRSAPPERCPGLPLDVVLHDEVLLRPAPELDGLYADRAHLRPEASWFGVASATGWRASAARAGAAHPRRCCATRERRGPVPTARAGRRKDRRRSSRRRYPRPRQPRSPSTPA